MRNCNGSESNAILNSPLQLKDLSITLTSKLQGSTPAPQASPGEIPAGCLGLAPRHGQPKVWTCGRVFCPQCYSRMNRIFSQNMCHCNQIVQWSIFWIPRQTKTTNEEPSILIFIIITVTSPLKVFFQSVNFQLALPAQNALQMVRNVQEISSYYLIDSKLKKQLEKKSMYLNSRKTYCDQYYYK